MRGQTQSNRKPRLGFEEALLLMSEIRALRDR